VRRALLPAVLAAAALAFGVGAQMGPRALGAADETLEQAVAEAEAAAAANTRMRVSVNAVGFNIAANSAAAQDLQAAASAGGGTYVAAQDVGQLAGALAQAAGGAAPPVANRGRAALLPAAVLRGAAENGARMTAALEAEATRAGLALLPAAALSGQLGGVNLALPQPLTRLTEWGRALGVDYVIYPRVLSVGKPFNTKDEDERIMTILVNVVDVKTGRMAHTVQIGAVYSDKTFPAESVAPPETAAAAAEKLLAGFVAKLPEPAGPA
jgi:hypothetical protein